ncbi:MAG: SNF2 family helicase [Clostridiales bacterium]|nr:SNF2 family helicase [Clostridiales bacterium]
MISIYGLETGTESYRMGEQLFRRGSVSPAVGEADRLCYSVGATPVQTVSLKRNGEAVCTCGAREVCEHIVAAALMANEDGRLKRFKQEGELLLGEHMLAALDRALPGGESVRVAAVLRLYGDGRVGLGLSVGQERLYAVKSVADLLTCFTLGAPLKLSEKFTYRPSAMRFSREDERLLSLLINHIPLRADSLRAWEDGVHSGEEREHGPVSEGRFVLLSGAFLHGVLRYFESHSFVLLVGQERQAQNMIHTIELPLCFSVSMTASELLVRAEGAESLRLITPDARYVLWEGRIAHLHSAQARVCRLMCQEGSAFRYPAREAEDTLATLLPALSTVGTVAPSPELAARLVTAPFKPAVYLDLVNGNVEARVEFHYGDTVLYPFTAAREGASSAVPTLEDGRMLLRDGQAEGELLDFFSDAGFVVRGGRILLKRSKDILTFCTQGVGELGKLCEVYASNAFEKVKPRRFGARAAFHMRGGRLVLTLLEEGEASPEILPVLRAIAQRQQYVRLKTGEFLDVRDMSALAPVVQELLDAAALDDPSAGDDARELSFGAYRAAYMVSMLRMAGAETQADSEVEGAMRALGEGDAQALAYVPQRLRKKLTAYQQRGCGWLMSLYEARMGGILADEMGLGKTVQVIAAISAAKRKDGPQKSMIVTPTSLTYHWLAEFKRFDESLRVRVIAGHREDRLRAIAELKRADDVDVILTSYPLLRRDIDDVKDIPLRFAVLDEAQSVKNAQSQGAVAAKELDAQVRIALTGTPMENHTGELWSIFDFALPGYLGTQAVFLRRYGGGEHAEELRERIRPFLMRRLKSEVLVDLPKKHEQSLYAAMTPEQACVYDGLMQTLRQHVGQALAEGSLPRARMQVLSILLKLRQVCCHPKLFLPDYDGTSGKLELLVQTVHNAIVSKRRMLIFSQFVGMLQIIRKRLGREGVQTLYLDGDTKPEQRQALCDRFNGGEGRVFLISLKAGGTGLNLTGADLVIHYDPWWNPATEDQATDRAHRIGQTHDVDVLKLIAQGTIEEKVTDLSKRKRAIFDRVVLAGETELSSLTEEDIRALFFT